MSLGAIPFSATAGNDAQPRGTVTAADLHGWPLILLLAVACAAPAWSGWATRRTLQLVSIALVIAAGVEMVTRQLGAAALGNSSPGPFIFIGSITIAVSCAAVIAGRRIPSRRRLFVGVAVPFLAIAFWWMSSNALLPHSALAGSHGTLPVVDPLVDAVTVVVVPLCMVVVCGPWIGGRRRGWLKALIALAVVIAAAVALSVHGPQDSWAYLWARDKGEVVLGSVQQITVADDSGRIVTTTTGPILVLGPGHYVIKSADPIAKSGPACDPGGSDQVIVSRGVVTSVFESVCFA